MNLKANLILILLIEKRYWNKLWFIMIDSSKLINQKFTQICTTVPTAITDKTSTLYTSINTACTTIPVQQASATPAQKLAALVSAITTACTTASQESTASTTPSQTQTASTQAFKDITDVAKELLEKQKFDPTITIDQGTLIKIYVNKDYKFPKAAIKNVMK